MFELLIFLSGVGVAMLGAGISASRSIISMSLLCFIDYFPGPFRKTFLPHSEDLIKCESIGINGRCLITFQSSVG